MRTSADAVPRSKQPNTKPFSWLSWVHSILPCRLCCQTSLVPRKSQFILHTSLGNTLLFFLKCRFSSQVNCFHLYVLWSARWSFTGADETILADCTLVSSGHFSKRLTKSIFRVLNGRLPGSPFKSFNSFSRKPFKVTSVSQIKHAHVSSNPASLWCFMQRTTGRREAQDLTVWLATARLRCFIFYMWCTGISRQMGPNLQIVTCNFG